jgi:hypothetical protein
MVLFRRSQQPELPPAIKEPLAVDEEIIFKERFSTFGSQLKLDSVMSDGWAFISFHCDNIKQYVDESPKAMGIILEGRHENARPKQIKANSEVGFILDHLTLCDVRGSYYDMVEREHRRYGNPLFPTWSGYDSKLVVRRLDFVLSDNTGKLLSYADIGNFFRQEKEWSAIVFSEKGDDVRVTLTSVFRKEDEKDVAFSRLLGIRNYSLESRLSK